MVKVKDLEEASEVIVGMIKGMQVQGQQKADATLATSKIIVCQIVRDWVKPYDDSNRPVVILSTHPRFIAGTRMDWGFFGIAIDEGYTVLCLGGTPTGKWKEDTLEGTFVGSS